ncbi:hypothetical protein [Kaistella sp.]|uniref:hypothetical protein n=1 Tax=Kaistella sp. TaxID=2782235 RepID=UPI003C45087F
MKIKTVLIILLLIVIIFSGIRYLGICVSEKYDTQLEGLNPTTAQIKKAEKLKIKINRDKKITLSIIVISLLAIYPVSLIKK